MRRILISMLIVLSLVSCSDDDTTNPNDQTLPDMAIIDITQQSEYDLMVILKESSDFLLIKANQSDTSKPDKIVYHNEAIDKDYFLVFNEVGIIDKVIVDDYVFIYRNFDGNSLDLGAVTPDGQSYIYRDLETSFNWDTLTLNRSSTNNWIGDLLNNVQNQLTGFTCLMTLVNAVEHNIPEALFGAFECGFGIGEAIGEALAENGFQIYVPEDIYNVIQTFYTAYDNISVYINCVNASNVIEFVGCFSSSLNLITNAWESINEDVNEDQEVIDTIEELETILLNAMATGISNVSGFDLIRGIITDSGFLISDVISEDINEQTLASQNVLALFHSGQTWDGTQEFSQIQADAIVDFVSNGGLLYIQSKRRYSNVLIQFGLTTYGNDGGNSGFNWGLIELSANQFISHPLTEGVNSIVGDVGATFDADNSWTVLGQSNQGEPLLLTRDFGQGKIVFWYGQRSHRNPGSTNNVYETDIQEGSNYQFFSNLFYFFHESI